MFISALIAISMLMSSCVLFSTKKDLKYPYSDQEFAQAIEMYNSILTNEQVSLKDKSQAHLRLGLLYSHYRNPSLDYDLALEHVETSIAMLNGAVADDTAINLQFLLKSITGIEISSIPALNRLSTENRELAIENAELRKTLIKLNDLEVELEKRRKQIR